MRRSAWPLLVLLAACAGRPAPREETPEAYRAFLAAHPTDARAGEVRGRLEDAEFARASSLHTVLAYRRFLDEFPDSAHAAAARGRLEALRFNAARDAGDAVSLRAFLREHPQGTHRAEAEALLTAAELRELGATRDPDVLTRLAGGRDPGATQLASAKLDDVAHARAKEEGTRGLLRYLREFPAGASREAAQVELFSRHLEGLLFSGKLAAAREEAGRNPLARRLPDLERRFAEAERLRALRDTRDEAVRAALPEFYLRSQEDLLKALRAPDPLERWQAAEELSQHASVDVLDPLLGATAEGRSLEVRNRALESLRAVVAALPPAVAAHELGLRLDALEPAASTPDVLLKVGVLHELSGASALAGTWYQRAFDPAAPDPFILRRWSELHLALGRPFSAAVSARQLAVWARQTAEQDAGEGALLARARALCAADRAAGQAVAVIDQARGEKTEFPEDLAAFAALAADARRLTAAKLRDAELALALADPHALSCSDRRVADRLAAGVVARVRALERLARRPSESTRRVFTVAQQRDPDPRVRQQAAALLAGLTIP